jgi:hypothetical protein
MSSSCGSRRERKGNNEEQEDKTDHQGVESSLVRTDLLRSSSMLPDRVMGCRVLDRFFAEYNIRWSVRLYFVYYFHSILGRIGCNLNNMA